MCLEDLDKFSLISRNELCSDLARESERVSRAVESVCERMDEIDSMHDDMQVGAEQPLGRDH